MGTKIFRSPNDAQAPKETIHLPALPVFFSWISSRINFYHKKPKQKHPNPVFLRSFFTQKNNNYRVTTPTKPSPSRRKSPFQLELPAAAADLLRRVQADGGGLRGRLERFFVRLGFY